MRERSATAVLRASHRWYVVVGQGPAVLRAAAGLCW